VAGEDARLKSGIKMAEDELNLIKNQIQQTLLDIREHILDDTNPFNEVANTLGDDEEVAIEDSGGAAGAPARQRNADGPSDSAEDGDESSEELDPEDDEDLSEEEMFDDDLEDEFEEVPEDDVYGSEPVSSSGGYPSNQPMDAPIDEFEPEAHEEIFEDDALDDYADEVDADGSQQEDAVAQDTAESEMAADGEMDLIKLASLVRWVAVTQSRLGPQRTAILLDTYEVAGRISPKVRGVMGMICELTDEDSDGSVPVRDIIASMVRMEGVLSVSSDSSDPNRLLGMLLELDDDPLDRLVA
jgi:archaellum component FlaD/FlaE